MSLKKICALLFGLIFLNSCSIFKEKISNENLSRLKKIAVISDLGPTLHYHYAGATALRNREQLITTNWNLDDIIATSTIDLLKKNPHFVQVDVKGLNFTKKPHFDQLVHAKRNGAKIEPFLNQLKDEGYDGLILIQAWRQSEDKNIIPGYGIYYDNRLLIHDQTFYFTAKIRVYSTHKKMELSSTNFMQEPFIDLKVFPKRKKYEEWPPQDIEKIKEGLLVKITTELPETLDRLGLITL